MSGVVHNPNEHGAQHQGAALVFAYDRAKVCLWIPLWIGFVVAFWLLPTLVAFGDRGGPSGSPVFARVVQLLGLLLMGGLAFRAIGVLTFANKAMVVSEAGIELRTLTFRRLLIPWADIGALELHRSSQWGALEIRMKDRGAPSISQSPAKMRRSPGPIQRPSTITITDRVFTTPLAEVVRTIQGQFGLELGRHAVRVPIF